MSTVTYQHIKADEMSTVAYQHIKQLFSFIGMDVLCRQNPSVAPTLTHIDCALYYPIYMYVYVYYIIYIYIYNIYIQQSRQKKAML